MTLTGPLVYRKKSLEIIDIEPYCTDVASFLFQKHVKYEQYVEK
jgi:hypothetical protein